MTERKWLSNHPNFMKIAAGKKKQTPKQIYLFIYLFFCVKYLQAK